MIEEINRYKPFWGFSKGNDIKVYKLYIDLSRKKREITNIRLSM